MVTLPHHSHRKCGYETSRLHMFSRARLHTTHPSFPSEHRQHLMMNTVLSNTKEAGQGPNSGFRHWFKQIVTPSYSKGQLSDECRGTYVWAQC